MEEIREAALAYYEAGTQEQKQLAWAFFQTLDVDGDGTVSVQEFVNFLRGRGYRLFDNPNFYRALDRDGNGCLDFHEVLTFFYIIKTGRPFCNGCRIFLKGLFFTCVECHESRNNTFDLCSACYRGGRRILHEHPAFLDNYTLLTHKRLMTMGGLGQPNTSQTTYTETGSTNLQLQPSRITTYTETGSTNLQLQPSTLTTYTGTESTNLQLQPSRIQLLPKLSDFVQSSKKNAQLAQSLEEAPPSLSTFVQLIDMLLSPS